MKKKEIKTLGENESRWMVQFIVIHENSVGTTNSTKENSKSYLKQEMLLSGDT